MSWRAAMVTIRRTVASGCCSNYGLGNSVTLVQLFRDIDAGPSRHNAGLPKCEEDDNGSVLQKQWHPGGKL